jgi:hypothetical protein
MFFYVVVVVAAIGFTAWFVHTPLFRGHLRRGKTPDQEQLRTGGIQYNDWKDLPPRD